MENQYTFTVFTATYNRAHTLHRVYESLKAQTFRDFEWLVIDDGSTDNTRERIEQFRRSSGFPIRYFQQSNRGLHIAFNRGVRLAAGTFFFPLDSDDGIVPATLERLKFHWDSIPIEQKHKFSGVSCLCQDEHGRLIGDPFPNDIFDSNSLEIIYKYHVKEQKGGFHRTEVLRQFPFDETSAMGSNPWGRIARRYQIRFVNEPLEIFYQDDPEHSLSRGRKVLRPITGVYRGLEILNDEIDWFKWAPSVFLRAAAHYVRFSFHMKVKPIDQFRKLSNRRAIGLTLLAFPLGYLLYKKDRLH